MARNRTCDRCGGKSSPHIPRKRAADGRMLCQGCTNASSRELKTAVKTPGAGGAKKKPQGPSDGFDFWDGELGPENVHPLQAPLPNSIWEKYAKSRALQGKEPFDPKHNAEAEARGEESAGDSEPLGVSEDTPRQTRLRLWRRNRGKKGSLQTTANGNMPGGPELVQHLKEVHGVPGAVAHIHGQNPSKHDALHADGNADHTHGPNGEVVHNFKSTPSVPNPEDLEGTKQHLQDHHGVGSWEFQPGDSHDDVKEMHDHFHNSTAYSGADQHDHTHPEKDGSSSALVGHPQDMSHEELGQHLLDLHGILPKGLQYIKDNGPLNGTNGTEHENLLAWHKNHHGAGGLHGGTFHEHEPKPTGSDQDVAGPETLKHPSKYTVSALHSHLLTDHGIDPDHMENAINGTLEGTHPSHVTTMLHDQMHKQGQLVHSHDHEGHTPAEIHPGHTDMGKPFWGAPPGDVQKSLNHLTLPKNQGGHGMTSEDVHQHLAGSGVDTWTDPDAEVHKAYEQVHGNLHKTADGSVSHQHVPTLQPGVKTPQQIQKEKIQQHLKDYHGISHSPSPAFDHGALHDSESFGYKGHPGHDHPSDDAHGPVVQSLPSEYGGGGYSSMPAHVMHHDHPAAMSKDELENHLTGHGDSDPIDDMMNLPGKSHEEMLQQHALDHATGKTDGHTHAQEGGMVSPLDANSVYHGHEPEIQTKTHAAIENDSDAIAHIIKHHPNVNQEHYNTWGSSYQGKKPSVVAFHDALHEPNAKNGNGDKLPKVQDGHDHAPLSGPPTQIAVGSHLVSHHGMDQSEVASMSPAEFKAHHEQLHLQKNEADIGHGHDYPGGPVRDPKLHLPNTHHEMFRDDSKHPATQEWYHGTGTDYDGAPKNATELKNDHDMWGNYGGGDWNNHLGTHWTSLHQMAGEFGPGGGASRVIHARLHIRNPITYNSLNHMSHDAYDRLKASGHMQDHNADDDGFDGEHDDDSGYNHCCSTRLLDYAKGHHRDDGKFGMEAYRDSLRADGYDGVHVRNQADSPAGHWNAVPLSADQVEITHGGCRGTHGDERDHDVREFNNSPAAKRGWEHPKEFDNEDYQGKLGHLPEAHEIAAAHEAKKQKPLPFKGAEGRGDSDPHLGGRYFPPGEGDNDGEYCEHCDEQTDHESDDCTTSKWCNVCGENGDHTASEKHDECEHCNDYADHSSEEHEDEYGEHPDHMRKEAFCPHCNESSKENYNSSECVNCHEDLPDWGKLQAHGKPVPEKAYQSDGETDAVNYGDAKDAKKHGATDAAELAAHLYHHHKSDVSGPAFDDDGGWDEGSLKYHHQWLHTNASEAKSKGFEVDHTHKGIFGQYPPHESMSPEQTKAHMMLGHVGATAGGVASYAMEHISKMTPEEAVEAHKKAHDADDAVAWGEKDSSGELKPKVTHSHDLAASQPSFDSLDHPKGQALIDHMQDKTKHTTGLPHHVLESFEKHPGVAEALHQQFHDNQGPSAEPYLSKAHIHDDHLNTQIDQAYAIKSHLIEDHGGDANHFSIKGKDLAGLMKQHTDEHGSFPLLDDPDHTHVGGVAHTDPEGHTAATMKKATPEGSQKKHMYVAAPTVDKWGPTSLVSHVQDHHPELEDHWNDVMDTAMDHGNNSPATGQAIQKMHEAHEGIHGPLGQGHPTHYHYDHEDKTLAEPKTAARTLTALFEEVAL